MRVSAGQQLHLSIVDLQSATTNDQAVRQCSGLSAKIEDMTDLVNHLERYLGPIDSGSRGDDTTPPGVQVIRFGPDRPFTGITTWATLGLSHYHLAQPEGHGLHQELVMHLSTDQQPPTIAGVLFQIAAELIQRGQPLAYGEVLGPCGRLFADTEMAAVVAASPVYLPDSFAVCDIPTGPVVLTWLIPLTQAEAHFALNYGWHSLEAIFVAQNPDLTNLGRTSTQ